ncbi:MAG: DUF2142 domain-containing protein [Cryobacterium sp.]|nr:DUF2142 domain-containing protein [Cryobacterium sp.]
MQISTLRPRMPRLSVRARLLVLPLLAFFVLAGWSYSSPVGSSPDDDYHLASIWCVAGDRTSLCEETGNPATRMVPQEFAGAPCFARISTASGACQVGAYDDPALVISDRGNFLGAYPPVFYGAMSLLVSDDVQTATLAMRMLNSALFVGLMTALVTVLPIQHRPMAIGSFLISIVPLGLFLIPSINPSSWAITGVGAVWLALLGYFDSTGRRRWLLGGLFVVGAIMAAGARADAGIYAVLAVAAVLLLRFSPSRDFMIASILPVTVVIVSLVAIFSAGQLASAAQGFGGVDTPDVAPTAPTVSGGP